MSKWLRQILYLGTQQVQIQLQTGDPAILCSRTIEIVNSNTATTLQQLLIIMNAGAVLDKVIILFHIDLFARTNIVEWFGMVFERRV